MPRPEVIDVVRGWVAKAEHDLRNGQYVLGMTDDVCPFDTICFHAQQAVEKYLKALLCWQGTEFYRTHDLTELHFLLPKQQRDRFDIDAIAELNPYAVEGRYPGLWDTITRADADRCITIALSVRSAARSLLPEQARDY
jgi:HEPN domain-containing protein